MTSCFADIDRSSVRNPESRGVGRLIDLVLEVEGVEKEGADSRDSQQTSGASEVAPQHPRHAKRGDYCHRAGSDRDGSVNLGRQPREAQSQRDEVGYERCRRRATQLPSRVQRIQEVAPAKEPDARVDADCDEGQQDEERDATAFVPIGPRPPSRPRALLGPRRGDRWSVWVLERVVGHGHILRAGGGALQPPQAMLPTLGGGEPVEPTGSGAFATPCNAPRLAPRSSVGCSRVAHEVNPDSFPMARLSVTSRKGATAARPSDLRPPTAMGGSQA